MKVIIVEVTRAANSFGDTHLAKIREAYEGIAAIVQKAQDTGAFKTTVTAQFAALAFYGAVEQVLTAWIFDVLPQEEGDWEQAKSFVVETVCGGLDAAA
jgi:TetR/AcrR family fatty acid metabolism transcriptional regulator